jgi:hypothetical protein
VGEADEALKQANDAIELAQGYEEFSAILRKAMGDPTPDNEALAWQKAQEAAGKAKKFYQAAQVLGKFLDFGDFEPEGFCVENTFPQLLRALASDDEKSTFLQKQAVCSRVASMLDCALRFDILRMSRPTIPNELSYYRRSLSKHSNESNLP